ncbi:MAG: hypothetical protein AB3N13_07520 [Arenibacterium sp.]
MIRRLLVILAFVLPGNLAAQSWELQTFDDGSFFLGAIRIASTPGFALLCGERSPQGLSPRVTGNVEPEITPLRVFRLTLSSNDIGDPNGFEVSRGDVVIISGQAGYRLPDVRWNELFNTWEADLISDDPLLAAMGANPWIDIQSRAGNRRIAAAGFSTSLGQLGNYCKSMFATIGKPWDATTGGGFATMRDAAESAIGLGCNGAARREDGYLLPGDIDGDGQEDIVLNWDSVICMTTIPRPFCGAAMCSAEVYLSSLFPRTGQPEQLLAIGVRIVELNNGLDGLITGGSLASCAQEGRTPCEYLYYWNGVALVAAP